MSLSVSPFMSPLWRNVLIGAVVVLCAAGVLHWRSMAAKGYFTNIETEVTADCRRIASPPGPEDMQIDRERGIAYIAAADRRLNGAARGGLYQIDLNKPVEEWAVHPVTPNEPADFRPHGVYLFIGSDGSRRLFVVNHPAKGDQVDIFDVADDNSLVYIKSVSDPLFVSINDVVAISPDRFYVTNDHGSKASFQRWLDEWLLLKHANIVYYDGTAASVAATGFGMANGINVSADQSTLYAADSMQGTLHVFARDPITGALTERDSTPLHSGLDNIDVTEDGALLIGAHPSITQTMKHWKDANVLAPSQVLRVEPAANGKGGKAGTIYLNKGKEISASSVAAGFRDMMLIGGVFDPVILACKQSKELRAH